MKTTRTGQEAARKRLASGFHIKASNTATPKEIIPNLWDMKWLAALLEFIWNLVKLIVVGVFRLFCNLLF